MVSFSHILKVTSLHSRLMSFRLFVHVRNKSRRITALNSLSRTFKGLIVTTCVNLFNIKIDFRGSPRMSITRKVAGRGSHESILYLSKLTMKSLK